MVEKSYSDAKPSKVSVEKVGKFTSVWLRKNIIEDTADQGPDGSESITFWTYDEVFFSVPGNMAESEALERFDELWSSHERDGMTAEEMAREAVAEAKEAKELAGSAGPDPQLQALATLQISTMSFDKTPCDEVVKFVDYWPEWKPDTAYKHNEPLTYQGRTFRASKDLTSQAIYPPGTAESEYYEVTLASDGIIVWYNVGGEYNMVYAGEKRHYPDAEGPVYEALKNTTYSPDTYPQHWKLAE